MVASLTRPFEAWCECPNCDRIDAHLISEPSQCIPVETGRSEVIQFGCSAPVRVDVHYDCDDEREFTVMRTCRCGHRWGEV